MILLVLLFFDFVRLSGLSPPLLSSESTFASASIISILDVRGSKWGGRKDCFPSSSSKRRKAVTAVHPECIFPSDSSVILERDVSTSWKVSFRISGMLPVALLRKAWRRRYPTQTPKFENVKRWMVKGRWDRKHDNTNTSVGGVIMIDGVETYKGEVLATPFCRLLSRMAVEDGEESLAPYASERDNDGMCILHAPPRSFRVCYCALEREVGRERSIAVIRQGDIP